MRKCNGLKVYMTNHAIDRWFMRVKSTKKINAVREKIKRRLGVELQKGVKVTKRGTAQVEVQPGIWAICCPSITGGWEVVTIIAEGVEDMAEKAKYIPEEGNHILAQAVIAKSQLEPGLNTLKSRCGGDVLQELGRFVPGEKVVILPEAYYRALIGEV